MISKGKSEKIIKKSSEGLDRLYKIVGIGTENQTPKDRKQYARDLSDILSFIQYELGDNTFFGGESLCLVDLMIWPLFERLPMLPILYPIEDMDIMGQHGKMSAWVENMKHVSSVEKYRLEPEQLATFYKDFANNKDIANFDSTSEDIAVNKFQETNHPGRQ